MEEEYNYHLKELACTDTELFGDFSIINKAQAYSLKIKGDVSWAEEVMVGEGDDPSVFLRLLTTQLLSLSKISREDQVVLQAHFFDLCDKYMEATVANEYELIRHTIY